MSSASTSRSETPVESPPSIVNSLEKTSFEVKAPTPGPHDLHPLAQLSGARKAGLLVAFSVSQFIDVCNISGVALAIAQISQDIKLDTSQYVWIITSYALCFAAFLLFAGRLSDLFPAQIIFEGGFMMLGVFSVVTSFVTHNKYAFLILRGLGGLSGAMTIPSSYHLAVHMFPNPVEQKQKLSLLSLSGALGNILGLVIAALCMLAKQKSSYVWFFRLLGILCIVFSTATIFLMPKMPATTAFNANAGPRWKRMDFVGVALIAATLVCFTVALTSGPINGWKSPSFIVPFVLAIVLAPSFFLWEAKIPMKSAVLPSSMWKTTNIFITSIVVLFPFAFFATSQIQYATYFQDVHGWKPIHVAAAILPQGIVGLLTGASAQAFPQVVTKPRYSIGIGGCLVMVAEILQIYSNGGQGKDYWKFCFPAFILGSCGAVLSFFASTINIITLCPPEQSGVASAWTQVLASVGGAITLAVQSGLDGKTLTNWKTDAARGYWFMLAFVAVITGQYVLLYKEPQALEIEHENARKRIRESEGEEGVEMKVEA